MGNQFKRFRLKWKRSDEGSKQSCNETGILDEMAMAMAKHEVYIASLSSYSNLMRQETSIDPPRHTYSGRANYGRLDFTRSFSTQVQRDIDSLLDPVPSMHGLRKDRYMDHVSLERFTHFVLVHGGLGARCWYKWIALPEDSGFKIPAIGLLGSGIEPTDPNRITSLLQYSKPLLDVLKTMETKPGHEKVTLVGHNILGGACISYAMECFPELVSKALSIAATMVSNNRSAFDIVEKHASESSIDKGNQTCDSSNSSPNNPFSVALLNELKKMDHVCEVSSDYEDLNSLLHGGGTIVFCCYDTTKNHFEFFFKDAVDMATIAGVGFEFAKVILEEGCRKVTIKEIPETEWKGTLQRVRSKCATIVYKALKLERGVGKNNDFKGYPDLWNLATYFTLQEAITTTFTEANTNGASSSKGSSKESSQEHGGSNSNQESSSTSSMRYPDIKGKRHEEDTGENEDMNGRNPNDHKDDGIHRNVETTVSIELLGGGQIEDASVVILGENRKEKHKYITPKAKYFEDEAKEKLAVLNTSIRPNLEFTFLVEEDGYKEIRCIVGKIYFFLDVEEKWLHHGMNVIFGLYDTSREHGKVVRSSFKHLDVKEGKRSTKGSRALGSCEGRSKGSTWGAAFKALGIGATGDYRETRSRNVTDTRQSESVVELSFGSFTAGGLEIKEIGDKHDNVIECRYISHDDRTDDALSRTSTLRVNQDVRFEGKFEVIEDPRLPGGDLVEYKLTASRGLEEVSPQLTIAKLYKSAPILRARRNEELLIIFNQKYERRLLLNHAMSHLDSKRHELRELEIAGETIFAGRGSRSEYEWRTQHGVVCDPLVKRVP